MELLPLAHFETATKRGRGKTCGSIPSFFGTRVPIYWMLRVAIPAFLAPRFKLLGLATWRTETSCQCSTLWDFKKSSTPSRSCAARLAAPRQADAFTIVAAICGRSRSLIMGKKSAQLARWAGTLVRTALLKPRPPKDTGNVAAVLCEGCRRGLQGSSEVSQRHCHTLASWVLANCSST